MKTGRAVLAGILVAVLASGCGGPPKRNLAKMLNESPSFANRQVHVGKIKMNKGKGAYWSYEAEIDDAGGKLVGRIRGVYREGLGFTADWLDWYAPDLRNQKHDRGTGPTPFQQIMQSDSNADGRVTFEEAHAANPHLLKPSFYFYDRNGDGAISNEDQTYQGPRHRWNPFISHGTIR